MLGLVASLTPFSNEGLQGYLARLASANAISIQEIMQFYRTSTNSEPMPRWPYPAYWQGIRYQITSPPAIPMTLWNSKGRRFCPVCIERDGFWHACWELTLVTECHEHKVELVHECPSCNMALSWNGTDLHGCGNCGRSLINADITFSDPNALWLSTELGKRLTDDNVHSIEGIGALNVSELHDLAVRFGARISEAAQKKPLKIKCSSSLLAARRVSNAAADLLRDWPRGFNRHLRKLISKKDREDWKMSSRFGRLYADIYRHLPESCFNFIRDEFESTLSVEWHGPVGHRNRRLSRRLVESTSWVPVRTAAARMRIDKALIRRMVKSGEIQVVRQTNPSGKTNTLVNLGDLHNRRTDLSATMNLEQASVFLSLPEARVRQMLQSNLLEYYGGSPSAGERWWISGKTIKIIESIGASLPHSESIPIEAETLAAFLRYRLKQPEMVVEVIARILRGDIAPISRHASPEAIGLWLFRINDLTRICDMSDSVGLLTVNECASALRVKEQVAYDLVRLALVESVKTHDKGVQASRVPLRAVTKFEEEFIFGRDLALHVGRSPRWLVQHLTRSGQLPVAGPGISEANCRQYVWRRSNELNYLVAAIDRKAPDTKQGAPGS